MSYLEPVYAELGVVMTDQVRRRFDEVQTFHQSVVRNRRTYLEDEVTALRARLADSESERARLGGVLATSLRTLQEGGALDALTQLQQILGQEQAVLSGGPKPSEAAVHPSPSRRRVDAEANQSLT